MYWFNGNIEV